MGWLLFGCSKDESDTTVPDVIISGTVTDQNGQPLSDVHIHLIYLFETSSSAGSNHAAERGRASSSAFEATDDDYDLGDFDQPYPTYDVVGGGPDRKSVV